MAKGRSSDAIVFSHFEIAWFNIERDAAHSVPFDLSTNRFAIVRLRR
jgi:hypothetical protein